MDKTFKLFILVTVGLLIFPGARIGAQELIDIPATEEGQLVPMAEPASPAAEPEAPIIPGPIKPSSETAPTALPVEKTIDVSKEIAMDENITAEDSGIAEPRLLPTNPYYPIKNIWRGVQTFFTFNPVEKAELKFQFANERLIEAKTVAENVDKPEVVAKALENYKKEVTAVSTIIEKVPEKNKEEAKNLAEKMIDNSFKQQKLIDNIEKKLEPEYFERVNDARNASVENFAKTVSNIVEPEKIQEKITKVIDAQIGSEFKNFKNVEILKAVEQKAPEAAKEAIRQAQGNATKRLQDNIVAMEEREQKKFKEYVQQVGGNEIRHLEIIQDFAAKEVPEIFREELEKTKEVTLQRIDQKIKEFKNEEQKNEFLGYLETGQIENLRIIKELENNLAPETINSILDTKNKALDNFRKDFEALKSPDQQEKFMKKMEELHDVKQLEIMKEMEKVIPEEQKEFFNKVKDKAMEEMKKEIEGAQNAEQRVMIIQKIAGDAPEHIQIIKEFGPSPEIMNEILKEQVANLSQKIETVQNAEKLQQLKQRIAEEGMIKEELETRAPELFTRVEEKFEGALREINKDMAADRLEKAKIVITQTAQNLSEFMAKTELSEPLKNSPASVLLDNARKHLKNAEDAFNEEKYGQAFGDATASVNNANDVQRIIREVGLREEIALERVQNMEKIIEDMREVKVTPPTEGTETKPVEPPMPVQLETIKKNMEAIKLNLENTGMTTEVIQKIQETKQNLPWEIQRKLKDIPLEMLPQAIEKLNLRVETIPAIPAQPREGENLQVAPTPQVPSAGATVSEESVGMANPASAYCEKRGGKLEIKRDSTGNEFGICHLPDGTQCEEWAFFKGECQPKAIEQTPSTGKEKLSEPLQPSPLEKIKNIFRPGEKQPENSISPAKPMPAPSLEKAPPAQTENEKPTPALSPTEVKPISPEKRIEPSEKIQPETNKPSLEGLPVPIPQPAKTTVEEGSRGSLPVPIPQPAQPQKSSPQNLPVPIPKPAETQSGGGANQPSGTTGGTPSSVGPMTPKMEKAEPQPVSAPGGGGAAQVGPGSLGQGFLEKIKKIFTQ